jgi:hypothetical protein
VSLQFQSSKPRVESAFLELATNSNKNERFALKGLALAPAKFEIAEK